MKAIVLCSLAVAVLFQVTHHASPWSMWKKNRDTFRTTPRYLASATHAVGGAS